MKKVNAIFLFLLLLLLFAFSAEHLWAGPVDDPFICYEPTRGTNTHPTTDSILPSVIIPEDSKSHARPIVAVNAFNQGLLPSEFNEMCELICANLPGKYKTAVCETGTVGELRQRGLLNDIHPYVTYTTLVNELTDRHLAMNQRGNVSPNAPYIKKVTCSDPDLSFREKISDIPVIGLVGKEPVGHPAFHCEAWPYVTVDREDYNSQAQDDGSRVDYNSQGQR